MLLNYRRLPIFISHIYMCIHKNKCKCECNDYTKKIVHYWVTKSRRFSITPKNLVAPLITKRFSNLNGKSTILSRKLLTKKYILFVCPKERLFPATIRVLLTLSSFVITPLIKLLLNHGKIKELCLSLQ